MKNTNKILLTLLLILISNITLFAQPGDDDIDGVLEGPEPPASSINDWLGLLLVVGFLFGYYILKNRKQIS
jgi:hypothetical protein